MLYHDMEQKINYTHEFFEKLGHLMYAIAVADGKMVVKEKIEIKKLIEEQEIFGSSEMKPGEIINATLSKLIIDQINKEEAFKTFKEYYLSRQEMFSDELKKNLMDMADKIASAYAGRNKSEAVIISKLYFLFQE